MKFLKLGLCAFLVFCGTISGVFAEDISNEIYKVAIQTSPGMIEKAGEGSFIGFEIDLWNEIANRVGINFVFEEKTSFKELLKSVQNGHNQFAIASISIRRDRADKMSFSQPYFNTGLSVLRYNEGITLWRSISTLFSSLVLKTIGFYLLFCFLFGFLFWCLERKRESDIRNSFFPGVFDGLWCAFKRPWSVESFSARLLNLPLWIITMLFTSLITAQVITNFEEANKGQFKNKIDYSSTRLGITKDTVSDEIISKIEDKFELVLKVDGYEVLYEKFKEKEINTIMADEYIIRHFEAQAIRDRINVMHSPELFTEDYYGIAISYDLGWKTVRDVDRAIMELRDTGFIKKIREKWNLDK